MNISVSKAPFLRNKKTTTSIMLELFAVLCVVWVTAIAFYFTKFSVSAGLRVLFIGLLSIGVTLLIDVIVALIKGKRKIKDIASFVLKSYSYITALIFALTLPAGTSYYVVVIGAIFATCIGKYVFGGFGNNIFNPAGLGRIFVALCFSQELKYIHFNGVDLATTSTITESINWNTGNSSMSSFNLTSTIFGEYQGAIGETFTALLLVIAIYLMIRQIINYRLFASYLITATLTSLVIGLSYGVSNLGEYLITSLSVGGLMFAATFMVTDPVTGPKSQDGKIMYGCIAGFLAIFIRVFSSMPEGVVFGLVLADAITPLLDQAIKGNTKKNIITRTIRMAILLVVLLGITFVYSHIPSKSNNQDELTGSSQTTGGSETTGASESTGGSETTGASTSKNILDSYIIYGGDC